MGTHGTEILDLDVNELIKKLNKALADEWLAYYQYWVGAKIITGPMRGEAVAELTEHANDELRHADMLAERITQLGGDPILNPKEWYDHTNCGYEPPEDPAVKKIIEQNIKAEQCAIDVYKNLADMTKDKDVTTYEMALEILKDEIEHEDDLQQLEEDLKQI
jgi:bacterioferritin